MDLLKNHQLFSFTYGTKPYLEHAPKKEQTVNGSEVVTVYTFEDGLKVTNIAKKHEKYGAWEWVNFFENTGTNNTEIISDLWDCDIALPCEHTEPRGKSPWLPSFENEMFFLNPNGSTTVDEWDFYSNIADGSVQPKNFLFADAKAKRFGSLGGRSSEGNAPFFNVHHAGKGWIIGIGWTGQWNAELSRTTDTFCLRSKIEDTHFCLYPNEKIRTSSILIMPYECSVEDSQNKWRRFLREEFSPLKDRAPYLPLCQSIWGGTESAKAIERIKLCDELDIPFEYVWMDAGWCGEDSLPTKNEYEGDWANHTGDWQISRHTHPNGLKDVAKTIKEHGKKYILWFEPERVRDTTKFAKEHPEYLLKATSESTGKPSSNLLMYLGNEDAWSYCRDTLFDIIERLDVDCYRQDFNFMPLKIWRENDTPDRQGITEIKHIMGLYRLWDALLERFPKLFIDNCASGGKRLDVETLRRSVPLWRSDAQCPANPNPETTQANHMNFSLWMPYAGTGSGRIYDTYRIRSAYASGLTTNYTYSEYEDGFGKDAEKVAWLKARCEEYLRVRPYFDGDIYHLTKPVKDETAWCAVQWDRPESGDGLLQVFRREKSPYTDACFELHKIDPTKRYRFVDIDGGEWQADGKELSENGLKLTIGEKRTAKIYFYNVI